MEIKEFIESAGKLDRVDLFDGFVQLYTSEKLDGATIIACGDNILKDKVYESKEEANKALQSVDYSIIAAFVSKLVTFQLSQLNKKD